MNNKCITHHYVHLVSAIGDWSGMYHVSPFSIVFHVVHIYNILLHLCMINKYSIVKTHYGSNIIQMQ